MPTCGSGRFHLQRNQSSTLQSLHSQALCEVIVLGHVTTVASICPDTRKRETKEPRYIGKLKGSLWMVNQLGKFIVWKHCFLLLCWLCVTQTEASSHRWKKWTFYQTTVYSGVSHMGLWNVLGFLHWKTFLPRHWSWTLLAYLRSMHWIFCHWESSALGWGWCGSQYSILHHTLRAWKVTLDTLHSPVKSTQRNKSWWTAQTSRQNVSWKPFIPIYSTWKPERAAKGLLTSWCCAQTEGKHMQPMLKSYWAGGTTLTMEGSSL